MSQVLFVWTPVPGFGDITTWQVNLQRTDEAMFSNFCRLFIIGHYPSVLELFYSSYYHCSSSFHRKFCQVWENSTQEFCSFRYYVKVFWSHSCLPLCWCGESQVSARQLEFSLTTKEWVNDNPILGPEGEVNWCWRTCSLPFSIDYIL